MIMPYKGGARTPGPLGNVLGTVGARMPGPLRFEHKDLSKAATTKPTSKTFPMPAPAGGSTTAIMARSVGWSLSSKAPRYDDVHQGELANCPIASILAALAYTASGRTRINNLITEYTGVSVKTTFTQTIIDALTKRLDDPDDKRPDKEIIANRYFTVSLDSSIDVSDVFYARYSDRDSNLDMIYMGSPHQVLWPCVIEKAVAVKFGSYDEVDNEPVHSANEYWSILVGKAPNVLTIDTKSASEVTKIAKAASTVPAIAASKEGATKVYPDHGLAILGMPSKDTIELFDPIFGKKTVSMSDFLADIKNILSGSPK